MSKPTIEQDFNTLTVALCGHLKECHGGTTTFVCTCGLQDARAALDRIEARLGELEKRPPVMLPDEEYNRCDHGYAFCQFCLAARGLLEKP